MTLMAARSHPTAIFDVDWERSELKANIHAVLGRAQKIVDDDPIALLDENDAPPVHHRIQETRIRVMFGIGEIVIVGR